MQPKSFLLITLLCAILGTSYCQEAEKTKVYGIRNSIAVYPYEPEKLYLDDSFDPALWCQN